MLNLIPQKSFSHNTLWEKHQNENLSWVIELIGSSSTYYYCSNLRCHPSFLVHHWCPSSIVQLEPATIYIILSHSAILPKVLFTYQLDPILSLKFIYLQQHSLPLYKAVFSKTVFGKHNFENILASVRALAPSEWLCCPSMILVCHHFSSLTKGNTGWRKPLQCTMVWSAWFSFLKKMYKWCYYDFLKFLFFFWSMKSSFA